MTAVESASTRGAAPAEQILSWLRLLYGEPEGSHLVLWTRQDKRSYWFGAVNLDGAAERAAQLAQTKDVYFGVGLHPRQLGQAERGSTNSVCAIPGLWLDVDIVSDAHKADNLPPDAGAAMALLGDFPLAPTAVVDSGHGLQAWWLFDEVWHFDDRDAHGEAAVLSRRFHAIFQKLGRERGWHVDSTHDLARVLRPPGTVNRKGRPVPVRLLQCDPARRYRRGEFAEHLVDEEAAVASGPAAPVGDVFPTGQQHTPLVSLAGTMRKRGMGEEAIFAALWEENLAKCEPPWDEPGIRAIAHDICKRYVPGEPGHQASNGAEADSGAPRRFLDAAREQLGDDGDIVDALKLATSLREQYRREFATSWARQAVRDDRIDREADLSAIEVISAYDLLRQDRPEPVPILGDLLYEGHNATLTARYKAGKTTLIENMAAAMASGGSFLGQFTVPRALRVVLLNYELTGHDMDAHIRRMNLEPDVQKRIRIVNLRGHRLPIMTSVGRAKLVKDLLEHGAEVVLVDPFGAAFGSAGGINENDNAEVRRFLLALDEAKREADCPTLIMPVHTGRGEQSEGDEHGRGATVLDDWADVRMLLHRNATKERFLRTEGRANDLDESRLRYDHVTGGLWIAAEDTGLGRRKAREAGHAAVVVAAVGTSPGIITKGIDEALGLAGITSNDEKRAAIAKALSDGLIHRHGGAKNAKLHYPGPDCEGGATCP